MESLGVTAVSFITEILYAMWILLAMFLYFSFLLKRNTKWTRFRIVVLYMATVLLLYFGGLILALYTPVHFIYPYLSLFVASILAIFPYQGAVSRKVLAIVSFPILCAAFQTLPALLFANLSRFDADPLSYRVLNSMGIIVLPVALFTLKQILSKKEQVEGTIKGIPPAALELSVPILSAFALVYIYLSGSSNAAFLGGFLLVINIIVFLLNRYAQQHYKQNQEYEIQKHLQQLRENHYQELEAQQAGIRSIKHDLANQLIAMGSFFKAGEVERADEQLGQLIQQLEDNSKLVFTDNAGVNGLLVRKYKEAEENGIECEFGIRLPAATGFTDADLTVLLGNILDNALDACKLCDGNRTIRLEVLSEDDVLIIRSENSTDGKAHSIKTRKKDTLRHGIGMDSIKQVVDKYNGQMEYHFSEKHFTIELSLFPNK